MRVLSVVGARPQFIKLSPIDRALKSASHEHLIVHTGQHYAPELSESIFGDLDIPSPDINLEVGSHSHAKQTAAMMTALEEVFIENRPDWVLAYGDTNSTIAAALSAVKLHLPIAHLEAGLRSYNRRMPEEHNRVVTDHLSDLLLAPTLTAMENLASEGLSNRSRHVGDVMADVCFRVAKAVNAEPPQMPPEWTDSVGLVLATVHRAENTDSAERVSQILDKLSALGLPVMLVAHPRLVKKAADFGVELVRDSVTPISSLTYSQMIYAVGRARGVITDSGGLQKEAFLLSTPCITVRTETEWPETLVDAWNVVDNDLSSDLIEHFDRVRAGHTSAPFGDGHAAEHSVHELMAFGRQ